MKYTYEGDTPTVLVIHGDFLTINKGDVVDLPGAPSTEFAPVVIKAKKKVAKVVPKKKELIVPKKLTTPKVQEVKHVSSPETGKLG